MTYVHMPILCLSVMYAHNARGEVGMETLLCVLMEHLHHPGINSLAFHLCVAQNILCGMAVKWEKVNFSFSQFSGCRPEICQVIFVVSVGLEGILGSLSYDSTVQCVLNHHNQGIHHFLRQNESI